MSKFYRVHHDQQIAELDRTLSEAEPGQYIQNLQRDIKIDIIEQTDSDIVFDLIGVDVSVANALRRILIAEVPTVAVETVWISANSGVVQDEILAHRVGLVPIGVDPRTLEYVIDEPTDADTLTFHLDVIYPQNDEERDANPTSTDVSDPDPTKTGRVLSSHLRWLPQGNQEAKYPDGISAVNDDILIAKLRPGQRIEFEAHCRKGVGKDHAKFSPVATASYRLLPVIDLQQQLSGDLAEELVAMCPMKVFDIEDLGRGKKTSGGGGEKRAVVSRPRDCTMCRECIRKEGWADRVKLRRKIDHFIFTVESTGCYMPHEIVREALSILKDKCDKFIAHADSGLAADAGIP
jgi:DNA-directed RNA polymerase I and III subunit RPAC1